MRLLALVAALVAVPAFATPQAEADWMLGCQGCHLPDARGFPAHGVPALAGFVGNFLSVDGGREYLVRVPGVAQSSLDDARLAALLNWMLAKFSARELPDAFAPFTAAEVAAFRRQPYADVAAVRSALLARMAAQGRTR